MIEKATTIEENQMTERVLEHKDLNGYSVVNELAADLREDGIKKLNTITEFNLRSCRIFFMVQSGTKLSRYETLEDAINAYNNV